MRKFILTAVLGLAAAGLLGVFASEAKAYPPRAYMNTFRVGAYSTTNYVGSPYYTWGTGGYGAYVNYGYPAVMRGYTNPSGFGAVYGTSGMSTIYASPLYGVNYYMTTPAYMGYSFNRYTGYKTLYIPSTTYSMPVGGGGYGGYYNSYVPSNYILP